MKILKDLPGLVQALTELEATDWIDLPQDMLAQLDAADQLLPAAVLTQPALRFIARGADAESRMGYAPWLPVAVLREMNWPANGSVDSQAWQQMLQTEFGRSQRFAKPPAVWADEAVPEPFWPEQFANAQQRLDFWHLGLQAHAWMDEESAQITPCSRAELRLCEWRLGCALPQSLRDYHLQLGVLDWAERLQALRFDRSEPDEDMDAIGPVPVVFPGIVDIVEMADSNGAAALTAALGELVAFGDYLGNGNLWCFDRRDGSVWYLDHDSNPLLTRVFNDVGDYLDTLTVKALCIAHAMAQGRDDGDERAESILARRLGKALIRKWMY